MNPNPRKPRELEHKILRWCHRTEGSGGVRGMRVRPDGRCVVINLEATEPKAGGAAHERQAIVYAEGPDWTTVASYLGLL